MRSVCTTTSAFATDSGCRRPVPRIFEDRLRRRPPCPADRAGREGSGPAARRMRVGTDNLTEHRACCIPPALPSGKSSDRWPPTWCRCARRTDQCATHRQGTQRHLARLQRQAITDIINVGSAARNWVRKGVWRARVANPRLKRFSPTSRSDRTRLGRSTGNTVSSRPKTFHRRDHAHVEHRSSGS